MQTLTEMFSRSAAAPGPTSGPVLVEEKTKALLLKALSEPPRAPPSTPTFGPRFIPRKSAVPLGQQLVKPRVALTRKGAMHPTAPRGKRRGKPGRSSSSSGGMSTGESDAIFSLATAPPNIMHVPRRLQTYTMSRMSDQGVINSSAGGAFGAYAFRLSLLPDYTDFTPLFDQFRVNTVEIWFIPHSNDVTVSGGTSGHFLSVVDRDDASVPATYNEVLERENVLMSSGIQGQYHRFTPSYVTAAEVAGGTYTGNALGDGWVDMAFPDTLFFGVKYAWSATTSVYGMDAVFRMTVSFRTVR